MTAQGVETVMVEHLGQGQPTNLALLMIVAAGTHIFFIPGSVVPALVLFTACLAVIALRLQR